MSKKIIFKAQNLPIHQNVDYPTTEEAIACPRGELSIIQDENTGLIHNAAFDQATMTYNENYQNEQAFSLVFQQHLHQIVPIITKIFNHKNIVEIGCGKGWFLELLRSHGFNVRGVDPAYKGDNDYVIKDYFSSALNLNADALILRHTLEHIQNPYEFLADIADANNNSGLIYIEVPCFNWILEHKAWFDIYYEHVNYFRLIDFENIFGKIVEMGHVFGDQYIYIIGDLATLKRSKKNDFDKLEIPEGFMDGVNEAEKIINNNKNKKNIVWGGASKGVIFCHYLSQRGFKPDMVIDLNPEKQGKYIPVTGIKINSPEIAYKEMKEGDNIFVMNSNYYEEIRSATNDKYNYILVDKL
jgi:uncharacterized UPF0146 family protein